MAPIFRSVKRNFTFPNGDEYFGEYVIDLSERLITRHGMGVYTKANSCQRFYGQWDNDKLINSVEIEFPNNQCYRGSLARSVGSNNTIEYAKGHFIFGDSSKLIGNFSEPVATSLCFTDPNGNIWPVNKTETKILLNNTSPNNIESCPE